MRKKIALLTRALSFVLLYFAAASFGLAQTPSYVVVSAPFSVNESTDVPSHTLAPGNYTIRILDSLRDRFILRIEDGKGTPRATFIGLRNPDFAGAHTTGPIFWASAPHRKTGAIGGFAFANGTTVEFVYPKDEAVALAQRNNSTVPAIDPESEGLRIDAKLSDQDRQIVTLWLLRPTRVGPGDGTPAIEAKRFRADASPTQTAIAAAQKPDATPTANQQSVASVAPEEESQIWQPSRRLGVTRLPQTASELPLVILASLLLLGAAGAIRFGLRTL
jgi:hypothetical protein